MGIHLGKTACVTALACASGLAAQHTQAATIIELSDGTTTVTVADGSLDDLSTTPGVVVFSGAVGVFDVNVTTGISTPVLGSAIEPVLDLDSVNVSGSGTGTLTIKMTTTDYTGPLSGVATLDVGGTTLGSSVTFDSFVDSGNVPFGTATLTESLGPFGPGAYAASGGSATSTASPFSATIVATIVHDDVGDVTNLGAFYTIVPEPGTLALIGVGGLLIGRRRRRA